MPHLVRFFAIATAAFAVTVLLTNCGSKAETTKVEYQMGERVPVGPLTYTVVESAWASQLGHEFKIRVPQQRFLLITISATNGGGKEVSVPLLSLEKQNGELVRELEDGEGVEPWFGLFRTIAPAQTQQGKIVFDVPLSSYRLRLTDGGETLSEKYAWVKIDLNLNQEMNIDTPNAVPSNVKPITPPIK